jgi:hypothetical protein
MIKIIIIILLIIIFLFIVNKKNEHMVTNSNVTNLINTCGIENNSDASYTNLNIFNNLLINGTEVVKYILDYSFPMGSFYVQFPDTNSSYDTLAFPESQTPEKLFGGYWQEQWPKESIFFRTCGMLSNDARVDGFQDYATKHLYGSMSRTQTNYNTPGNGNTGVFSVTKLDEIGTDNRKADMTGTKNCLNIGDQVTVSNHENVAKNRKVRIWKRIGILPNGKMPNLPINGYDSTHDTNYYDGPLRNKIFSNFIVTGAKNLAEAKVICNLDEKCGFIGYKNNIYYTGSQTETLSDTGEDIIVWQKQNDRGDFSVDENRITFNPPLIEEEEIDERNPPKDFYIERPPGAVVKDGQEGWTINTVE